MSARHWRRIIPVLLPSWAALAFLAATFFAALAGGGVTPALAGPAACSESGGVATCTGNQSQGIQSGVDFSAGDTILNVPSVSGSITPPVDTNGILFSGATTVEINSNVSNIVINGYGDGILGTAPGAVDIDHSGNIYDAFRGINGFSINNDVTITDRGVIDNATEAAINGYAPNGSVTIGLHGRITDAQNRGISGVAATTSGTGTVSITSNANIDAVNQAIYGLSVGGTTISSIGNLTSESIRGISAEASGGIASIDSAGDVESADTSLYARSTGGNASATSHGDVTSHTNTGIDVESTVGTATINSNGDISAANQGLFAYGATGASITSDGDVTTGSTGNDAIFAFSNSGPASVTSHGDINAPNGRGAVAITSGGAASVDSDGSVTAKGDAVYAMGGSATVTQYGDVSSTQANGISAYGSSGAVSITGTGDVTAHVNGITAYTGGTGNATIDHTGDVTATGGQGVRAQTASGTASVVQNGDVTATATNGVVAYSGNGSASAAVTGNVQSGGNGIEVDSTAGNATITGSGTINANTYALFANAQTSGAASITHSGDVTSGVGTAIEADAANGNITIDQTGDSTGALFGIKAIANGAGNVVTVTSKGDVTATQGDAIYAEAMGTGGTASVNSTGDVHADRFWNGTVYIGNSGILVRTDGNGSVTSHGDVSSVMADAINMQSQSGSATVTSVGTISAANQGVFAYGKTGASIDSTGAVTTGNDALFAFASGSGSPANVTVTSVGDVTSTVGRGIVAMTNSGGDAIITSTGKVDASVEAVTAFTFGNGNASVTQTGDVISHTSNGIKAHAGGNGDATVTSKGDVTAQVEGITAHVSGNGNATVTQTGDTWSSAASGIVAEVLGNGTSNSATITSTGTVHAQTQGVSAFNNGGGTATVNQTGDVTSTQAFGIRADVSGTGTASVTASGTVHAKLDAITAQVHTSGSATVDYTGDATSDTSTGLSALASGTGNATIDASGTVHSVIESLLAVANTGTATIDYNGSITSSAGYGANAVTTDGNVVVDYTGDITSKLFGIQGIAGGNNRSVDITFDGGTIMAAHSRGIYGQALGTGSTVTINSTGNVTTSDVAIFAHANGAAEITSTGNIDATQNGGGRGLYAWSDAGLASITSNGNVMSTDVALYAVGVGATIDSTGSVTATSSDAVYAQTTGIGDASVTSRGDVTSNNSRGIVVINNAAALGSVLIDSVGKITANDTALIAFTDDGNATIHSTGDVSSTVNQGIQAQSLSNGYALITSTGDVNTKNVGIIAQAHSGSATITQTGDVTTDHTGIEAISELSSATITSTGAVDVRLEGLKALANNENTGSGSASITQVGNVTSSQSFGINSDAWGTGGNSTVDVTGDVHGHETAIQSMAFGGSATASITSVGAVTSDLSNGIQSQAEGSGSKAIINAQGDVNSKFISVFGLADSDVTIDYTGNATSTNSDALLAQSNNGAVTVHSNGNLTGNSLDTTDARHGLFALGYGLVDVTQVGDVTTSSNERAIQAQSTNGNVQLNVTGHVYVDGTGGDSDAIFAFAPNGYADVTIGAGSVITGGTDPLASFGVEFGSATGTNTLTNWGTINDANGGKTIGGDSAADVVLNHGLVDGDFYLGTGANRFDNLSDGWTYFKTYSSVGVGNDFNNTGSVTPIAPMVIGSSVLDGNFKQTGTGSFWADLDYGNSNADYLDVTGNVTAGGTVHVYVTNLGTTAGPVTATIIHSNGVVTDAGIAGVDQGPLMVTVSTTPTTVVINAAVDFGVDNGLSGYSQPVGDFLQNLFTSTVTGGLTPDQEAFYLGLINYGDTAAYDSFLSIPATTATALHDVYSGAGAFADNLFSCRQEGGANRFVAEGSCVWTAGGFRSFSQNATDNAVAFDDSAFSLSGGQQFAINPNWAMGFGVGFENGDGSSPAGLSLDRNIFSAGLVAKGTFGPAQIAGALTAGGGTIDSSRQVTFPVPGTVTGDRGVGFLSVTGRASYTKDMGSVYLKPMVEAAATYAGAAPYTESGGGAGDYAFDAVNQFVGRGTVSVELGGQFAAGDNIQLRPYISAGLTVLSGQNVNVTAGLPGLGPGTFTTMTSGDSVYADLKAGVYAFGGTGWSTRLEYDGRLSANSAQHSGSLKLSIPF